MTIEKGIEEEGTTKADAPHYSLAASKDERSA
jgi:hypothetical protein